MNDILVVIPARGGSKGLPGKNIKNLGDKPLICYSIDVARAITFDDNICISTDDPKIIDVVEQYGLKVPFVRPAELASDTATTNDVLLHAVKLKQRIDRHHLNTGFGIMSMFIHALEYFCRHSLCSCIPVTDWIS